MNAQCFKHAKHIINKQSKSNSNKITMNYLAKKFYNTSSNNQIKINTNQNEYYKEYIELRSDVKTIPTKRMLENIQNCFYGDDCFNEDPTTNKLLTHLSDLFNKESALFVPSGTMGNMACLSLHAERGDYIIQGHKSHIHITEMASQKLLGFKPLTTRLLDPINPTAAKFDPDHQTDFSKEKFSVEKAINEFIQLNLNLYSSCNSNSNKSENANSNSNNMLDENAQIKPKAIALENTHNYNGGVLLDMKYFKESILPEKTPKSKSKSSSNSNNKIALHLDGSRILNASVALAATPASLTADFDTVNICLSKALGAPCGSVIFLENKNYEKAKGIVKALGGGMRQNGVLAAAALTALEDYRERFEIDHENAKILAEGLGNIQGLNCPKPQSNIVNVYFDGLFFKGVLDCCSMFDKFLAEKHNVLTHAFENGKYIRCVLHHQVSREQVYKTIKAFENVVTEFQRK